MIRTNIEKNGVIIQDQLYPNGQIDAVLRNSHGVACCFSVAPPQAVVGHRPGLDTHF